MRTSATTTRRRGGPRCRARRTCTASGGSRKPRGRNRPPRPRERASTPSLAVPVRRADGHGEVVAGAEIAVGVEPQGQLGQGGGGGAEHGPGTVEDVEARLVARAQQLMG